MQKFVRHTGIVAPLRQSNVDTDQICASGFLKRITKTGYEDALFAAWRTDPSFVLNDARYAGASVLVAGPNFGSGSSREHAVWALRDYGFTVVLASRFADIFRGNAGKQGLLAATLPERDIEAIWSASERRPGLTVTADLERRTVTYDDTIIAFAVDDAVRWRMMAGLDDIDITLKHADDILDFESRRPWWKARVTVHPREPDTSAGRLVGPSSASVSAP